MTSTKVQSPKTEITTEDYPFIEYFGTPLFFMNTPDDIKNILSLYNFTHFYVLGKSNAKTPDNKVVDDGVRLFLVVKNVFGVSIQPVASSMTKFALVEPTTKIMLPKIPRSMIAEIDAFLREVDKRNGTEGIVILTYDTSKTGAEGWNFVVPDQKNTSVHCDYDPMSLAGLMPNDTTFQVGTIHSHPGMKAYKSDTDQKDQLAFGDGIHITFGWSNATNQSTEYYCEVQFGKHQTVVSPDYLFDDYDYDVDNDKIGKLIDEHVKKTSFSSTKSSTTSTGSGGYSSGSTAYGRSHQVTPSKNRLANLPSDGPKKDSATIIVPAYLNADTQKAHCSGCGSELCPPETERRKCMICKTPIWFKDDSVDSIIECRKASNTSYDELDIEKNPSLPIFWWHRTQGEKGIENVFETIYNPKADSGK